MSAISGSGYDPRNYVAGRDRYVNFAQDFIEIEVSEIQRAILQSVAENQRTLVWGANGPGKSYITAGLKLGFLSTNPGSIVLGTSGSYQQYYDTMWRALDSMHTTLQENHGIGGQSKGGNQPVLKYGDEWYCKVVSPRSPGELEGRHGSDVLVVIDEADKKYVTEEHFDSAGSSITDINDKMVAICNPPDDETNVVYEKRHDNRWNVVDISSFEARNVRVDAGLSTQNRIEGIVDLLTIAGDWEAWNGTPWPMVEHEYPGSEPWPGIPEIKKRMQQGKLDRDTVIEWLRPGFDIASNAHKIRTDLDERWYKRRVGQIPPAGAEAHRPIYAEDIQGARMEDPPNLTRNRYGAGVDIGRTRDSTAIIEVRNIENTETPFLHLRTDVGGERTHGDNESMIRATMEAAPMFGVCPIDADAEGSGTADQMDAEYEECIRFNGGMTPVDPSRQKEFKNRRTEALALLGEFLREGGKFSNRRLEKELFACSRVVQYNRRRSKGRDVWLASKKEKIKDRLGRSPDVLDAAAMAVYGYKDAHDQSVREVTENQRKTIPSTW